MTVRNNRNAWTLDPTRPGPSASRGGRTGTADLHIHTTYSDGTATVAEILAHVAARDDLGVIAITDHDTITGALEARRLAPEFGVEVVVGEEVSTTEGHLLALFVEDYLPPGRPAAETIAAVHAQGGLCVAAHPYDWASPSLGRAGLRLRSNGPRAGEWPLDASEAFNASLLWPRTGLNRQAQRLAAELDIPAVGGSDAHTLAAIGSAYTCFDGQNIDDLYRAIRSGAVTWHGRSLIYTYYLEVARLHLRQRGLRGALHATISGSAASL